MLFRFFLLLLRFTYVGYINGWQSYNTTKFPQVGVNDYRKSQLRLISTGDVSAAVTAADCCHSNQ